MFLKKGKKFGDDDDDEDGNPLGYFFGGLKEKMDDAGLGAVTNSLTSLGDKMSKVKEDIAGQMGLEEGGGGMLDGIGEDRIYDKLQGRV
jgi:hypothetical protein